MTEAEADVEAERHKQGKEATEIDGGRGARLGLNSPSLGGKDNKHNLRVTQVFPSYFLPLFLLGGTLGIHYGSEQPGIEM